MGIIRSYLKMFMFVGFQINYDVSRHIIIGPLIHHAIYKFPNFWAVCGYFESHESTEMSVFI